MKPDIRNGVQNKVNIVVRDMDKAMELYSELLNTTFDDMSDLSKAYGVRAAISWEAGIELLSLAQDGGDSAVARELAEFLEKRGEGILGITFSVDDIEAARLKAEKRGIGVKNTIEWNEDELERYFYNRFKKFKEYILADPASTCGVRITLGQFEVK